MKRLVFGIILGMLIFSFMSFAIAENNNSPDSLKDRIQSNIQQRQDIRNQTRANIEERREIKREIRAYIQENRREYRAYINGRNITFEDDRDGLRLRIRDITVRTILNLSEEDDNLTMGRILRAQLSNGKFALVKIMPDTASEKALQRLRIRACNETNNCAIQLREVGEGNQTRAVYEMNAEKRFRLLGLFERKAGVRTQIDSETGNAILERKPWWAFIASEREE